MPVISRRFTAALSILATSVFATDAFAASVSPSEVVSGSFSGSFDNVQGATTPNNIAVGSGQATWGTTTSASDAVGPGSSLKVSPGNFSDVFPPDGQIKFGTFTWYNASSFNTGRTWTVDMTLDIDFDTPTDLGTLSEKISLQVNNTTDAVSDTAANEASGRIPDIITGVGLPGGAFSTPVDLGNGLTLSSVFMQLDECSPLASTVEDSSCELVGGTWTLREGAESTIGVYGTIESDTDDPETPEPPVVPLPAAGWMLLAGMGGLWSLRRFKKV